jgi:hypothetical protein
MRSSSVIAGAAGSTAARPTTSRRIHPVLRAVRVSDEKLVAGTVVWAGPLRRWASRQNASGCGRSASTWAAA